MKVKELRELLEEMDDNAEVRFAEQPKWSMESTIRQAEEVDGILYLAKAREALGW
ncbi:MAG: hypothetical protein Q4D38_15040 [Planctomycetia bacterium]|nr:hypothetical protein [Planctomycetia bacterium]